jgi:hypothetical protein
MRFHKAFAWVGIVSVFARLTVSAAEPPSRDKKMRHERPPVFAGPSNAGVAAPTNGVVTGTEPASSTAATAYQQAPVSSRQPLVSREQANAVTERFKRGYARLGSPRIVLFVNRELVDEASGLKIAERREKRDNFQSDLTVDPNLKSSGSALGANVTVVGNVQADSGVLPAKGATERVTAETTYKQNDPKTPALADKQTVRDVERLFGRPLRMGGAKLSDQRVASQIFQGHSVQELLVTAGGVAAGRDREALMKVADVVVEILISARPLTVPGISGDLTYQVPDIQATAIRLSDAQILGQASATDILGPDRSAGRLVRSYDVREITEATALALMEDMMQGGE